MQPGMKTTPAWTQRGAFSPLADSAIAPTPPGPKTPPEPATGSASRPLSARVLTIWHCTYLQISDMKTGTGTPEIAGQQRSLEVQAYRGSPGIPEVAGRARGRLESCQKWSFPVSPLAPAAATRPAGGRYARGGASSAGSHRPAGRSRRGAGLREEPRCEVELTEVHTGGKDWWTLGFEATGPAGLPRRALEPPPRPCSPRPCPEVCNPAQMNPGPIRSGWASSRAPARTPAPED
jgi:hypothetical protein